MYVLQFKINLKYLQEIKQQKKKYNFKIYARKKRQNKSKGNMKIKKTQNCISNHKRYKLVYLF